MTIATNTKTGTLGLCVFLYLFSQKTPVTLERLHCCNSAGDIGRSLFGWGTLVQRSNDTAYTSAQEHAKMQIARSRKIQMVFGQEAITRIVFLPAPGAPPILAVEQEGAGKEYWTEDRTDKNCDGGETS